MFFREIGCPARGMTTSSRSGGWDGKDATISSVGSGSEGSGSEGSGAEGSGAEGSGSEGSAGASVDSERREVNSWSACKAAKTGSIDGSRPTEPMLSGEDRYLKGQRARRSRGLGDRTSSRVVSTLVRVGFSFFWPKSKRGTTPPICCGRLLLTALHLGVWWLALSPVRRKARESSARSEAFVAEASGGYEI